MRMGYPQRLISEDDVLGDVVELIGEVRAIPLN